MGRLEQAVPQDSKARDTKRKLDLAALPEGVRAVMRLRVEPKGVRFGLVAMGNVVPTWRWFIGGEGECVWMVADKVQIGKGACQYLSSVCEEASKVDWLGLPCVDVVLIQGACRPPMDHPVWSVGKVKVIVWCNHQMRGGRKTVPKGWLLTVRRLDHAQLGGVTDGRFMFGYATRATSAARVGRSETMFPNYLRQIWNPTESGRLIAIPDEEEVDGTRRVTTRGLLPWQDRRDVYVCGPTVFSKIKWVSRKLTRRELADAVDLPAVEFKKAPAEWQDELTRMSVPGKVLVQAVRLIVLGVGLRAEEVEAKVSRWEETQTAAEESEVEDKVTPPGTEETNEPRVGVKGLRRSSSVMGETRSNKRVKWSLQLTESLEPKGEESVAGETPPEKDLAVGEGRQEPFEGIAAPAESTVSDKAVKSDKAEVPRHLWDERVAKVREAVWTQYALGDSKSKRVVEDAIDALRMMALRWWKRRTCRSFFTWFNLTQKKGERREDLWRDGIEALSFVRASGWWEWVGGSGVLFWRWPLIYQDEMRVGVPPYFIGPPPRSMDRQPAYASDVVKAKVAEKVQAVLDKGYVKHLEEGEEVESLMYMFHVPKGSDDVRMVYDGSKSGLNRSLYAPWFHIHTVDMMCRSLLPGYWCADNDYGEQFLNFNLHPELQRYCGVDLTQLMGTPGQENVVLGKWKRCAMGLRPSPYAAVKGALIARRLIMGDRKDRSNPFRWNRVVLNQPGDEDYQGSLPWIMQVREDGKLATAVCQYIDDLRTCAPSEKDAWEASCRIGKVLTSLGLQDAARKRREPSQSPGAWSGATVVMTADQVFQSVTQERWVKTQTLIRWIAGSIGLKDAVSSRLLSDTDKSSMVGATSQSPINHKRLESARGFLVYVANTFKAMVPYLKGIHLTLDSWRNHRDQEGWKIPHSLREKLEIYEDVGKEGPPVMVHGAARLAGDITVLMQFTSADSPPLIPARPAQSLAMFVVGDASGTGFGGSTWKSGDRGIKATVGAWDPKVMRESSNFKEAYNLVLLLEHQINAGEVVAGSEVFIFTDNSTAERAFNKGSSTSKLLHELVVRIRSLEMKGVIFPRFVWIAGERMIAQGTDGLSRGDQTCGVMNDGKFLRHVPLNKTVMEYEGQLREEVESWIKGSEQWLWLREDDWFDEAFKHPKGNFVWTPSAALARVAIEQMCEVKHIHPYTNHMFLTPALMTGGWRKLLGKQSDVLLTLPAGPPCWPASCYEPLVLSLTCALLPSSPWIVRETRWIGDWVETMREVWKTDQTARRNCMREFWIRASARVDPV